MAGETSGLRLLMVTPRYFPYMGGIETHVYEVGRRLAAAGVHVTLLTTVAHALARPFVREQVSMHIRTCLAGRARLLYCA
ncbi:MAG: hypothetical protein IMW89_03230 [Ktedonobacteraceae bacterium]|nr:hypothetical protein [Ktedonobacteraceae bacterium]